MSAIPFGRRAAPSLFLVLFAAPSFSEDLGGLSPLVLDSLQREQFAASETSEGLEAPNPAHEFRTRFDAASIELAPQIVPAEGESWSMTWRTTRWGRAGSEVAAGEASRNAEGPRVEYRYASGLVEWYVNRPEGLEQGFAIAARPQGAGPLVIAGKLPSGLAARLADGAVELLDDTGTVRLRYGELHAFDANGRELSSRMETSSREIRLLIDDADATYPIDIDPMITNPAVTLEANQASSYFGWSTATAGDVNGDGYSDVIVGVPSWSGGQSLEGRVFLYLGSATGLSTSAFWAYESNQANARLGWSVAPAGDVNGDGFDDFLVGAPFYDNGQVDEGRAFLFKGTASGTPTLLLTFENNEEGSQFGFSVGWAGDVNGDSYSDFVIGAPEWGGFGEPLHIPVQGAARLYLGSESPDAVSDWGASGIQTNCRFGCSVAGAGDVNGDGFGDLLVGADLYDLSPFNTNQGTVKLWYGSASGISGAADWQFNGSATGDSLGYSVAGAGDIDADGYADVIVGAPGRFNDTGAVSIFRGGAAGLPENPDKVFNGETYDRRLGQCVATMGDLEGDGHAEAIAGAPGSIPQGRVLIVFSGTNNEISATLIGGPVGSLWYGHSVCGAGDVDGDGASEVLVSAPANTNGQTFEGMVYLYTGWPYTPAFDAVEMLPTGTDYSFGNQVASAGDVNGDGIGDFLLSILRSDAGGIHSGEVELYFGSETGIGSVADWSVAGHMTLGGFGRSAASAGDVNGDGYADIVIGADAENTAYVFHGSASGPSSVADWSFTGEEVESLFGRAVAGAGDVNGDGYADIVVGAPLYNGGVASQGCCRVFFGSPTGVQTSGAITLLRNQGGAHFGLAVASAGDIDRDGFDDMILAAPHWDNTTFSDAGAAFIYRGGPNGPEPGPIQYISIPQTQAQTGTSVGTAGDLDADGYSDVLIGAPFWDGPGEPDIGKTVVARGSPTGLASPTYHLSIGGALAKSGWSVGTAGDVNADGFSDIVIGSLAAAAGGYGKVVVWPGAATPSGLGAEMWWWSDYTQVGTDMVAATAGDLTGDGFPEIVEGYPHGGSSAGHVRLHYGCTRWGTSSTAIPQIPVLRTAGGDPVALGGLAQDASGVELAALARTPAGRVHASLEHQMAPMGQTFPAIGAGPHMDSGPAGGEVELAVTLPVTFDARHRWRLRVATANPFFPHGRWMTNVPAVASLTTFRSAGDPMTGAPEVAAIGMGGALRFESIAPNPTRSESVAEFTLARRGRTQVDVLDVAGRRVASLFDSILDAGIHHVTWDGAGVSGGPAAAGVYFVRIAAGEEVATRKVVRVK